MNLIKILIRQKPTFYLEDLTGTYEVTLFPMVYSRYGHLTVDRGPYVFEGRVQDDFGTCSLIAVKIKVLENGLLA